MFNKILVVLIFCLGTSSCSDNTQTNNVSEKVDDAAAIKSETTTEPNKIISAEINSKPITFVKTTDGSPFSIDPNLFDSAAAKHFLITGENSYIGDAEAINYGKKRYNLWSCTQCHGPTAKGQVGPGLTGPDFRYPKDATNKGMFETIWAGTNGGMGAKGFGLMVPDDGITPDELLKIIAFIRSNGTITGNQ
jgi:cytochrome c-L